MRRLFLLAVAPAFAAAAAAQTPDSTHTPPAAAAAGKSVWQGAYSEDQASRGSNEHSTNCTSCHGAEKYTGDAWTKNWVGRTVFDLYDQLRTTMPDDNPGGLSAQQYKVIVAYILKLNGLPSGTDSLADDPEAMRLIKIDPKPDKTSLGAAAHAGLLALFQSAPQRPVPARPTSHARVRTSPTHTR
jgi:S-disulfanyl-L-cysteine oxidoreductase SoxD